MQLLFITYTLPNIRYHQTASRVHPDAKVLGRYVSGMPFIAELKIPTADESRSGLVLALNTYSPAVGTVGWIENDILHNDHVQFFANAFNYSLHHALHGS